MLNVAVDEHAGRAYTARFLFGREREAVVVLPRDISPSEAEMVCRIITGVATRTAHESHDHAKAC